MKKEAKQPIVETLGRLFETNDTFYLIDFKRMTVAQAVELRKTLRKAGYAYKVIKNRLALRALGEKCPEALRPIFQKPTAVAFADKEPVALAKILKDFSNQGKILAVKGGQVEGQILPAGRFDEVTKLGSRQALIGQIGYLMANPLHRLMRTLQAPLGNLGILLGELKKTKNT
ncbi:MAG TPA: 50S ribosomal protein L10 [Candidatus Aminicenantes bacterium]|nr:50S ribosomal protein L10 [Candidatus Aminicenantes bacterium]HRY65511.1 50S ribosomal protein L10 [Candidatus Aminicenantes bacterium]HRZ73280.1 50S ribosomal protein L10 [Candidatus Aminicenantes bacterium]